MEQLKIAWVYRFWIAVGIVLVLPIVGYFVNTRTLAASAQRRKTDLEATKTRLKSLSDQKNPNRQWADETTRRKDDLNAEVGGAWEELYKRQVQYMQWPTPQFKAVFEHPEAKTKGAPVDVLLDYQANFFRPQLDDLLDSVKPVSRFPKDGLVRLDEETFYKQFEPGWSGSSTPASVSEILVAQEDVWILRALFAIVRRANERATKWEESAIKRISEIEVANVKAVDDQFKASKSAVLLSMDNLAGGPTAKTSAPGRYLPGGTSLYRQIPVYLDMIVAQWDPEKQEPLIVNVLAEFANSGIPMQITQVDFVESKGERPARARAVAAGKQGSGALAPP